MIMEYQNLEEATSDMIGKKIADKITNICNRITQKQLQTNMINKDLKKERRKSENYGWSDINIMV